MIALRRPLLSLLSVVSVSLGVLLVSGEPAHAGSLWWSHPYARQITQPGDADLNPWHINHVYELQYRLKRLGFYTIQPTGYFGSKTTRAVKRFQKDVGLPVTGVADRPTWRELIPRSTRGGKDLPKDCTDPGWHACYDRTRHQVTLFHRGEVVNSWLVRGGEWDTQTRTGKSVVYSRVRHAISLLGDPMPYSLFFDGGEALHGSIFMVNPFEGHSLGCVNFYVKDARQLWRLTEGHKVHVHVYGAWD